MTNITSQNTSIMAESVNYTRVYKNVAKSTDLNWQEKAILSEIITAQTKGKPFKTTDSQLSKALDIDEGNVNKYIRQLAKRGIITKSTASIPSHSGGKPKRRRTIEVVDIENWTHDNKKPVFTTLNVPKKRKPKTPVQRKSTKKEKEAITSTLTPPDNSVVDSSSSVVTVEDMERIDTVSTPVDSQVLMLNENDIEYNTQIAKTFIQKLKGGEELNFLPAIIDFKDGQAPMNQQVLQVPFSNKYMPKVTLMTIDSKLFED
jgi:predicted transcriptional regulator